MENHDQETSRKVIPSLLTKNKSIVDGLRRNCLLLVKCSESASQTVLLLRANIEERECQ